MKRPFFGGVLLVLPLSLLAFTACGDESVVNSNIKQISEDEPQSSESLSSSSAKFSSSSAKSSKKSSSSKAEEASDENDIVESEGDLPRCSIKREGMEVYVKEEKNLYTCEEGEWIPEKKTVESSSSSKKYSSSSNKNPFDIVDGTSSSAIYIDVDFSSSSKVNPVVVTGLGSCAPVNTSIERFFQFVQSESCCCDGAWFLCSGEYLHRKGFKHQVEVLLQSRCRILGY